MDATRKGFWGWVTGRFSGSHTATHASVRTGIVEGGSGIVGKVTEPVGKVVGASLGGVGKATGAVTGTAAGLLHPVKRPLKTAGIAAGIVAGVVAIGAIASSMRRNRRRDSSEELAAARNNGTDDLPQLMTPQELMASAQQPTMMGMQPVPGAHANRVMAARGLAPQQPAPVNPAMSVVPEEAVQNLGPNAPTR